MQSWRSNCQQGYTQEWVHCENKMIQLGSGYTQHDLRLLMYLLGNQLQCLNSIGLQFQ